MGTKIAREYEDRIYYDLNLIKMAKEISLLRAMWLINWAKFHGWFRRGTMWGTIALVLPGGLNKSAIDENISELFEIKSVKNPSFGVMSVVTLRNKIIQLQQGDVVLLWRYSWKRGKAIPWRYFQSNY